MNMYGLMEQNEGKVTMAEVENSFGGNICRCTGYRPILDAMKSFAVDSNIAIPAECGDIEDLKPRNCPKTGQACSGSCLPSTLVYEDGVQWHWPKSLSELFDALDKVKDSEEFMLVAGNTAHGVYRRSTDIKHFIDVQGVEELHQHSSEGQQLKLGANLSLTQTMEIIRTTSKQPGFEYLDVLWNHIDLIANVPVRNVSRFVLISLSYTFIFVSLQSGTLAGNISIKKQNPEFPSDIFISFEALNVKVVALKNAADEKEMSLAEYLGTNDKKLVLKTFVLPAYPKDKYIYESYKVYNLS